MHRALIPFAMSLLLACPADDGDDDATAGAETDDPSATSTDPSATDPTATATATDPSATTTDPSATGSGESSGNDDSSGADTDDTGTGDTGTTTRGDTAGNLCEPSDADDACVTCAKATCCDAYAACFGDPDCVCALECILETGDYATCLGPLCNAPESGPVMDIGFCYGMACAAECGF